MFQILAPAPVHMPKEKKRCGSRSTLQPPIVIHHPELHGPFNNAAIPAQASAYVADIPPAPYHTDTGKYLIIQKEPVVPLLLQNCRTSFKPVRQVSDLWDKNLSSCIKINDKSMFTEKWGIFRYCGK